MLDFNHQRDIVETLGLESASGTRRLQRLLGVISVVVIAALALAASFYWHSHRQPPAPRYLIQEVRRGDLTVTVSATGVLEPLKQVDVGTEVSGTIETVAVDDNDRVKRGQVLARLDTDRLEGQLSQSKAALKSAEARLKFARATVAETRLKFQRCQKLAERQLCPKQDLDTAEATYERALAEQAVAKALIAEATARLKVDQTNLAKAVILSPIDGIVLRRRVEPGQTVAASFQTPVLFTLAESLAQMQLKVAVDEADVGQVQAGQSATFAVDAYPNRTFPAAIMKVNFAPETVEGVVTYETLLGVDNADLALRPGMTATAEITVQRLEQALLVPNAALRFTPLAPEEKGNSSGGLVKSLFGRYSLPRQRREGSADRSPQKRVFILRNSEPVAIPITVGATDGQMTEVVTGDVSPGLPVLVDLASPDS